MRSGLVFGVGLAIMVAAPAVGQSLPPVPTPSLPSVVPNLPKPPALPTPTLPSAPSVPSLPHVPASPSIPAVPSVPGVGSQGGSSGSIVPTGGSGGSVSGGGGSGGGGRAAGGGRRSAGSGAASSAPRAGGGNSVATGRQGGSGFAPTRPADRSTGARERAEVRRDRRLRANVRPLERCVGALPRPERRVLTLRAGLGSERPRTRQRVAQILDVSTRRVSRLERRGVRRLRGLVRAGRCSGDAGIPPGDVGGGTIPADQAATLGALAATGVGAGALGLIAARELNGSGRDRIEVKAERESSGGAPSKPAPPAAGAEPLKPRPPAAIVERGGADLTLPLLIVLAVAALALVVRAVRRT